MFKTPGGERVMGSAREAGAYVGPKFGVVQNPRMGREIRSSYSLPGGKEGTNNPLNAANLQRTAQLDEEIVYRYPYGDMQERKPSTAPVVVTKPMPPSALMAAPPIVAEERGMLEQVPGPLSQIPPNPIAMHPGLAGEQMQQHASEPGSPFVREMGPSDPEVTAILNGQGGPSRPPASARRRPLGTTESKMAAAARMRERQGTGNRAPV